MLLIHNAEFDTNCSEIIFHAEWDEMRKNSLKGILNADGSEFNETINGAINEN